MRCTCLLVGPNCVQNISGGSLQAHSSITELPSHQMHAIKQIDICAEYQDMLPRPQLVLLGTPGFRPIGLWSGYWQTNLALGSMSRYSGEIVICIPTLRGDALFPENTTMGQGPKAHFGLYSLEKYAYKELISVANSPPYNFVKPYS